MADFRSKAKTLAFLTAWVAVALGAYLLLGRIDPEAELAEGWTYCRDVGATRGVVAMPGGRAIAGGLHGLFQVGADGRAMALDIQGLDVAPFVQALMVDSAGRLWVGHDQGLSIRHAGVWTTLRERDGMPPGGVAALAQAPAGEVWAATRQGVFIFLAPGPWRVGDARRLHLSDGLPAEEVSAILFAADGATWVGTYAAPRGGVARLDGESREVWTPDEVLPHANVTCLAQTRDGRVWAGCGYLDRGGAVAFAARAGRWQPVETVPRAELVGPKVRSIHEDPEGLMWLGSEANGLTIRRGGRTLRLLSPESGFPAAEVMCMAEATDGAIWLGTLRGVLRIDAQARRRLVSPRADGGENSP